MKKIVMIGIVVAVAVAMVTAGVAIVIRTSLVPELVPEQPIQSQGSDAVVEVSDIYFQEVLVESARRMPPGQGKMRGLQLRINISRVDPEVTTLYSVGIRLLRLEQTPRISFPPSPEYLYRCDKLYDPQRYSFGAPDISYFPVIAAWPSFYTQTDLYGGGNDNWIWERFGYRSMPLDIAFILEIAYTLDLQDLTKRDYLMINLDPLKNLPVHKDPELSYLPKAYDL